MGRPENTISGSGAVADFAQQLRLLRQHEALTIRQLAAATGLSTATLSVAASGRKLPSWEVARAYVQACGGDTEQAAVVIAWRGSNLTIGAAIYDGRAVAMDSHYA